MLGSRDCVGELTERDTPRADDPKTLSNPQCTMFYLFRLHVGSTLDETTKLNYYDINISAISEVFP